MKSCSHLFTKSANSVEDIGIAGQEAKGMVEQLAAIGQVRALPEITCVLGM